MAIPFVRLAEWSKWLASESTMLKRDRIHARRNAMAGVTGLRRGTSCGESVIYELAEARKPKIDECKKKAGVRC